MAMIEIKDLSYGINDDATEKEILKNVNLTFEDGKIYVITGPNGSGKSTLVKLIMGIIKPCAGRIIFDGKDITDLKINERANLGISYAFQQPVTFKGLKVRDLLDVASGKKNDFGQICDLLWERLYLWYDGTLNPCDIDHLSTLALGNINCGTSISEIWKGNEMETLRKKHLYSRDGMAEVCSRCIGY